MAREMAEPTPQLAVVVERCLAPANAVLRAIVADILGPGADAAGVARCAQSVVGQCRHFVIDRPVIARLYSENAADIGGLDALAAHVARFSLAALRGYQTSDFAPPQLEPHSGDVL